MNTRLTALVLSICMLFVSLLQPLGVLAEASTVSTGTVFNIDDRLRVRDKPSGTTIGYLYNGDVVTILGISDDKAWYNISKGGLTGWSSAEYIKINASYQTDGEFEAHLTAQGFPEDYKAKLRQIHAMYPKWVFMADKLAMTWDTAVKEESKVGRNTITEPDAWKSMEYGAYNWDEKIYVPFDSGGWVSASPAIIAYYMDPRNFLDATQVFQFEDLHYATGQTVNGIKKILPNALDTHASDILKVANENEISAYHLATRMAQEGSHNNGLGTGTVPGYEGYYNFFHIGAYAGNQYGANYGAVTNGAIYAQKQGWNTPYKCLQGSIEFIKNKYINRGQSTPYFQKFNVVNASDGYYSHQYMSNIEAVKSEASIRKNRAEESELNNALVFHIPIYKDMPSTPAPLPSEKGDNNNFLDSLTVKGHSLTPSFDRYTMSYSVHAGDATQIEVTGVLNNKNATLTGGGPIQLFKGDNEIKLTVTATSGEKRTYTVIVTTTAGETRPDAPVITGKIYNVSDTITKVEPETTLDKFIGNLAISNGTAKIFAADGKQKTQGHVATGDILRLYSGETLCASYPILIYGDVNGDGKVTPLDLTIARKHILDISKISGYYLATADANKDGNLTPLDLTIARKFILKMTTSIQ